MVMAVLLSFGKMNAQGISVTEFHLAENDMTAYVKPVSDYNGERCALIRLQTTQKEFLFDGGSAGIAKVEENHEGELWIWVPYGIKQLSISHQKLGSLQNYVFPVPIQKGRTYIMKIADRPAPVVREERLTFVEGAPVQKYAVVVGSISLLQNAQRIKQRLVSKGYNASIMHRESGTLYDVIAYSSNSLDDAARQRQALAKDYPDDWLMAATVTSKQNGTYGNTYAQTNTSTNKPVTPPASNVKRTEQTSVQPTVKQPSPVVAPPVQKSTVDADIPTTSRQNTNMFAVVIGNEKYENEESVPFAENDAKTFKEYAHKTLGVPEKQIRYVPNGTLNGIRMAVRWLSQAMDVCNGQGQALFYYAGHGIPDEANKTAFLLPVDGAGNDPESAYSLERLYRELGKMPAQSVTVFLDACFSGAKREGGMLASAARGVAIKVRQSAPQGKMVVFTAAQGDETAYPFHNEQHGMFTYFLLKKLRESKGDVTLGELGDYLTMEVKRQSFVENGKPQTPAVMPSTAFADTWRKAKLK